MRIALLTLALFGAGTAQAGQPFSQSMAECSAIYAVSADWVNDEARKGLLSTAADQWRAAALAQAQTEGLRNPQVTIDAQFDSKRQEWLDRGRMAVFSEEFGDWFDYCRSFAKNQGIDLGL